MDKMMRSIVVSEFGGPEVLVVKEVPVPRPSAGQVLVKIEAAGVNPVDTYLRSGNHAHAPQLPYVPGKDGAGVVEMVGDGVTGFKKGDRVYTAGAVTGTYAEYALCLESQLGPLPDNVTFAEGAGIWTPYATAFRALFQKAQAAAGETVVIHGASGGVGIAAVQWAKQAGLKVIGTASSEAGRESVVSSGADAVFDHTDAGHIAAIAAATGGADVILEMLANENLENDFGMLKMFGRIVVIGNRGSIEFTPRHAMTKDATIYGMSLFNALPADVEKMHQAIFSALSAGTIKPHVSRTFELAEAARSHTAVIEEKANGKIVLIP